MTISQTRTESLVSLNDLDRQAYERTLGQTLHDVRSRSMSASAATKLSACS